MVGKAIAIDLVKQHSVTSVDISEAAFKDLAKAGVKTIKANLADKKEVKKQIANADIVVGAVPGFMGFETVKTVLEAKKNIVDISFFPEDALELDKLAKKNGVTAITDCGVAPGMDNILLGYHYSRMKVESFTCMVGGLPVVRTLPFQYKAPFSPIDVIEEYTRPARLVENGAIIIKAPLSEPELIQFDEIGTLEAFNTDGLRTLMFTMPCKNMKEKTLRYPGHREVIQALIDSGMFSETEIDVKGTKVRPLDVAAKILLPQWKLQAGEQEFTVMRIEIEGKEKGKSKKYTYDLFDRYNTKTNTSSMARTTGYTCNAAVNLVLNKMFTKKGLMPSEYIGETEKNLQFILGYLKERGVVYKCKSSL